MDDYDHTQRLDANIEKAKTIYSDVRDEFYAWKAEYIAKNWDQVFPSSNSTRTIAQTRGSIPPVPTPQSDEEEDCVYSWTYDKNGNVQAAEQIPLVVQSAANYSKSITAHPPYQFVVPAPRNVWKSTRDLEVAPFLPFPEDPNFPRESYLSSFRGFQWETDDLDPDTEVIQYETVRRLHFEGLSAEEISTLIDGTSFRPLRSWNASGLLWEASQRDRPNVIWGDGQPDSSKQPLPPFFGQEVPPTSSDLFTQVNQGRQYFCFNLNCIQSYCHIHVSQDWQEYTSKIRSRLEESRLTSEELFEQDGDPCGKDCFRHISPDDMEDTDVAAKDLSVLSSLLQFDPDTLPCDLARCSKLPCRQSFFIRRQLVNDDNVPLGDGASNRDSNRKKRSQGKTFEETKELHVRPCNHPGPCARAYGCNCFEQKTFCERNCFCPPDCERRWRGCNETCGQPDEDEQYTQCKREKACLCRRRGRECDPEKCTACDARDLHVHHSQQGAYPRPAGPCHNVDLQRGKFKNFEIRRAKYGLGAFALEDMKEGDQLGEYVGELIHENHAHLAHNTILHKHSNLNYCFDLESKTTVDAQWLGNPLRFLNDAKPRRPNCAAEVKTVNGEKRLLILACAKEIKAGQELTLSYGESYWGQKWGKKGKRRKTYRKKKAKKWF